MRPQPEPARRQLRIIRFVGFAAFVAIASISFAPAGAQQIHSSQPIPIADGPLHEYPDLAVTADGTLWIAFMSLDGKDEVVSVRPFRNGDLGEEIELMRGPMAVRPRIAAARDGSVWIVWTGEVEGLPQVLASRLRGGKPSTPLRVSREGEAWHPVITIDENGTAWIAWEEHQGTRWRIMAAAVSDDRVTREPFTVSASDRPQMRPALEASGKHLWLAWDEYAGGYDYDVFLRRLDRDETPVRLTGAPTLEQAPSLAPAEDGGIWIAWHSNRADDGSADVPRWIELRHWNGKTLEAPAAPMPGKDLSAAGSMQSFEFPSLLRDGAGRIWLFGRPSQSFYAQVFLGDRWSELVPFGVEGWGGRGQIVAAVEGDDGAVWTARRDIGAIVLQRLEWKGGEVARRLTASKLPDRRPAHPAEREKQSLTSTVAQSEIGVDGFHLFFGDIHQHSSLSDGMGTVDDAYTRSRDRYGFDFAALTDHEWFVRNRLLPSEWKYIESVTASFHDPGRFVTIPAYEWTGRRYPIGPGHKNVYFLDDDRSILSLDDSRFDTTPELFDAVKREEALAVPHHIGWTGVDWENHDPVAQPDVEIVSVHGAFESMGNLPIGHRGGMEGMFVQDGLARGLRFGLLGSSDGHGLIWHHGVGRKRDPWQQGLTGVWAAELTREAIFEALRARRVYATSGARIQVWFSAEGGAQDAHVDMGGELSIAGPPTLRSRVVGAGKIRYVHLLRDNQVIYSFGGDAEGGRYGNFTYVDERAEPGAHWYYLRVVQEDDEMAWSSPIWIEVTER